MFLVNLFWTKWIILIIKRNTNWNSILFSLFEWFHKLILHSVSIELNLFFSFLFDKAFRISVLVMLKRILIKVAHGQTFFDFNIISLRRAFLFLSESRDDTLNKVFDLFHRSTLAKMKTTLTPLLPIDFPFSIALFWVFWAMF